jgi:hypothetical protein
MTLAFLLGAPVMVVLGLPIVAGLGCRAGSWAS